MSLISISSVAPDFSKPDIASIGGVQITRLPSGEALGAHDLQRWSHRRSAGLSKSYTTKAEREVLNNWTKKKQVADPEAQGRSNVVATIEGIEGVGWIINYPDGRTTGNFENRDEALDYVRRYGR
jgi:hypothetical protein